MELPSFLCFKDRMKYSIINANIYRSNGLENNNVFIENGIISEISDRIPDPDTSKIIDVPGCWILPAFTDMHVHLREPGYSYKETIKTGTQAAAAGGFTTICPMPNLNPAPDSIAHLQTQLDIINRDACIDVLPFATITKGRSGKELVDYKALAPMVAGFSDDGSGVQDTLVMKRAMKGIALTGKILAAHCEVESLLCSGYIHDGEYAHSHNHRGICSRSEWKEVERDIILAEETGCRLHICHVSTKESVELIRKAKNKGLPVTCETGPHYLTFNDSNLREDGKFKMNPPIRSLEDQKALQEGVIDGTIDVIATDHAPHSSEEKSLGLEKSAMGVVGLETAFAAVYTTMVETGLIDLTRLMELMTVNPRKILGLPYHIGLTQGMASNIVIIDPQKRFIVSPAEFRSMGRSTPYEGMELKGKIKMTFYKGKQVYC